MLKNLSSSSLSSVTVIRGESGINYFGISAEMVDFYELVNVGAIALTDAGVYGAHQVISAIIETDPQGVLSAYASEPCAWLLQNLIAQGSADCLDAAQAIVDAAKSAPTGYTL